PTVLRDDPMCQRQSNPVPFRLRCKKGNEDLLHVTLGDPRPSISNLNYNALSFDRYLPTRICLSAITHQVEQREPQHAFIRLHCQRFLCINNPLTIQLLKQRCKLGRAIVDQFRKRHLLELQRLRPSKVQERSHHPQKIPHFIEQRACRHLRFVVQVQTLKKLCVSLQRRNRILELMGQPRRHLTKTLKGVLQRDLFAQL